MVAPTSRCRHGTRTVGAAAYGAGMSVVRFATFATAVGCCAVAWAEAGVVGEAMGRRRFPLVVPWHRVLGAGGANGGFCAPGGVDTKLKLPAIEGATLF